MTKYDVTAYPILAVRIKVEADSPREAVRKAEAAVDWAALRTVPDGAEWVQEAEGWAGWLVDPLDEEGRPDYDHTKHFDGWGQLLPQEANDGQEI